MSVSITGALMTEPAVITANTRTTVFTADRGRTTIVSLIVTPTSGTPNLSISRYDGTTRTMLRKEVAMTAGTALVLDVPFVIDQNGTLEVQSSSGTGDMDVLVTYLNPVAPAVVRAST